MNALRRTASCLAVAVLSILVSAATLAQQTSPEALSDRIRKIKSEIFTMELERDRVLLELSIGSYCSECNRSKSEIEKAGEDFEKHLDRVKGERTSASPEVRAQRKQEYTLKLQALESTRKNLEASHGAAVKRERDERYAAQQRERDEREAARNRENAEREAERDARYQEQARQRQAQEKREEEIEALKREAREKFNETAQPAARIGRMDTVREGVIQQEKERVSTDGQAAESDMTLHQVGGGLKAASGSGKIATALIPPTPATEASRKLIQGLREGATAVSSGAAIYSEANKGDMDGAVAGTAKMTTSAAKAADLYEGERYKGQLKNLGTVTKAITAVDKVTDEDYAGATVEVVKIAKDKLPKHLAPVADRVYDAVDGALEIYSGIQQISEGQTEKQQIAERTDSTLKNIQDIEAHLKKRSDEERKKIEALIDEITALESKRAQLESQSKRSANKPVN